MSLLWLIVIPPLAALLVYPLRKLPWLPSVVSAATMLALGFVATRLPEGQSMSIMGRALILDPLARHVILLMSGTFALLFLFGGEHSPGRLFYPLGLVVAGTLAATVLVQHLAIAALFLELGAIFIALQIPGQDPNSAQSTMRYLVIITLAVLPLLLVPWIADMYALSPDNAALPRVITAVVVAAMAVLLGVVPFHVWLPPLAEWGPPVVTAVLAGPVSATVWYRLLHALQRYPWIGADPRVASLLVIGATWTAIVGAALAFSQRKLGRLMAYAAISDLGVILMGTGATASPFHQPSLYHWVTRCVTLALMAMCVSALRHALGGTGMDDLRSAARRFPVTTLGLLVSGLSLAGLPLTAGSIGRWIMLRSAAPTDLWLILALPGSSAATGWAFLRFIIQMLAPSEEPRGPRERLLPSIIIALTTLLLLALTWYARPVLDLVPGLGQGFFPAVP